jgi:hypothetical protein
MVEGHVITGSNPAERHRRAYLPPALRLARGGTWRGSSSFRDGLTASQPALKQAHAGSSPAPGTMPFGSASARPWHGRAVRVGTGGGLHAVVAQEVRASARQAEGRRFEAGQPLACRTSPIWKRRPVQAGKVRGSSPRFGTEGEPARVPGSPAKRCAGNSVAFESPTFLCGG